MRRHGREFQECEGVSVEIFPVLGEARWQRLSQAMVRSTIQRLGSCHEPFRLIGSSDNFGFFETGDGFWRARCQKSALDRHCRRTAFARNGNRPNSVAAMRCRHRDPECRQNDDGVQQQTQRIDENMPLLALDQFCPHSNPCGSMRTPLFSRFSRSDYR